MSLPNPIPIAKQINIILNHANYSLWRFKALQILADNQLTGYLDGTNLCPSRFCDDGTTNIAVEYWHRQDQLIQLWLLASLSITIISDMGRYETSQQIWDHLETMHNNHSLPRVDELMLELETVQRGNATCGDYLKRIGVIVERLRLVGADIPDQDVVFYTLQGLGQEFEVFISDVTGQSTVPLTMANLHYLLLIQEKYRTAYLYFTAYQSVGHQHARQPVIPQPVIAQQAQPSDNSSMIGQINHQPQFRSFGSPETCYLAESLTREITQECPNVDWDNIKGLDSAKNILKEAVMMPIKYPKKFSVLLSPAKGILLFGPPGTGKTMLAKAVATKCKTTFFDISESPSVRERRGDPQILVKVVFELARHRAPSMIFLDNIDSIISKHNEASRCLQTELLIQMDGLAKTNDLVFVLAATNLPWELDAAILHRLTKKIMVPLPESEARCAMFKELLPSTAGNPEIPYESMVERTKGYSGSDIRAVCQVAIMHSLRTSVPYLEAMHDHDPDEGLLETVPVKPEDIAVALLTSTAPSECVNEELYRKFNEDHGTKYFVPLGNTAGSGSY